MSRIRLILSLNYWRYAFSLSKTINAILGTFGIIWMLVEPLSFFSETAAQFFKSNVTIMLLGGMLWVLKTNWPKTLHVFVLKNTDVKVQLLIGDLFKCDGDLVIPFNTSLDTSFEDGLISRNSVQGQFTEKYFGQPDQLDEIMRPQVGKLQMVKQLADKHKGNPVRYEMGTILKIPISNSRNAYLTAIADMNEGGNATTNYDNILLSLGKLWEYVMNQGDLHQINMPVLGTGTGRLKETREKMIKTIASSFIAATSSGIRFADTLNIVVSFSDYRKHNIDIDETCDFLRLKCNYYEYDKTVAGVGQGIG
jgi:hypothetical protein